MMNHEPEVIALAKLRMDREFGEGTWDELVHAAKTAPKPFTRLVLDHKCKAVLDKAELDFSDVMHITAEFLMKTGKQP